MYKQLYIIMYVHVRTCMYAHSVHNHTYLCCTYVHMYIMIVYICTYICMHACICMSICTIYMYRFKAITQQGVTNLSNDCLSNLDTPDKMLIRKL